MAMRCGECGGHIHEKSVWYSITHTKHDPTSDKQESTTIRVCNGCYGRLYKSNDDMYPSDYDLGHPKNEKAKE